MTGSVESRILSLKFDNVAFNRAAGTTLTVLEKLGRAMIFPIGTGAFDKLQAGMSKVTPSLGTIETGVGGISTKFLALGTIGVTALANITSKAVDAGLSLAKSLTIDPIKAGFGEYEKGLGSMQTILANTQGEGAGIPEVSAALDELNEYADQTIYNFGEMANNIGTFTAAGVDLKTSTQSIKGIANLAALSGSNSQQASTAMYQLSQAIAAGKVGLQDWNSVVNAGMGGAVFQKALTQTAVAMGKVDGATVSLANGKLKVAGESFRESISAKPGRDSWLTSDVLTETLKTFTGDMTDAQLAAMGFNKEQVKSIQMQAMAASDAATKVKTLTQLIDTTKEAVGSGWAQTWKLIFGDFEEAKTAFSRAAQVIGFFVKRNADARNKMFQGWSDNKGRDYLVKGIGNMFNALYRLVAPFAKAFRDIFPRTTGEQLAGITKAFYNFSKAIRINNEAFENIRRTMRGVFAVLHIVFVIAGALFKGIAKYFFDFIQLLAPGAGGILGVTGSIGDMLVAFDKFVTGTLDIGGAIGKLFDIIIAARRAILEPIIGIITAVLDAFGYLLTNGFDAFVTALKDIPGLAKAVFSAVVNSIFKPFTLINKVLGFALDHMGPLGDAIQHVLGGLAEKFKGAAQFGRDLLTAVLGPLVGKFKELFSGINISGLDGILDTVKSALAPVLDFFQGGLFGGADASGGAEGVFNKLLPIATKVGQALGAVFDGVVATLKFLAPLAVFVGQGIAAGFGLAFQGVKLLWDILVEFADILVEFFSNFGMGFDKANVDMDKTATVMEKLKNFFVAFGSAISAAIGGIGGVLGDIVSVIVTAIKFALIAIGAVFYGLFKAITGGFKLLGKGGEAGADAVEPFTSGLMERIKGFFERLTFEDVIALINTGFVIALYRAFKGLIDSIKPVIDQLGGVFFEVRRTLDRLGGVFDATTEHLKAMTLDVKANAILKIAAAILVLAGVIYLLSLIPGKKIAVGLGAITLMLAAMTGVIKILEKESAKNPGKDSESVVALATAILLISIAMLALGAAVAIFGNMDEETLKKGLISIGLVLAGVTAMVKSISGLGRTMIAVAFAVGILAVALLFFAATIKVFSLIDTETLKNGLTAIALSLAAIAFFMNAMPKNLPALAAGLLILSAALVVMAVALKMLGGMEPEKIAKALWALGLALLFMVVAINAVQRSIRGAKALAVLAAALLPMALALKILGSMSLKQIGLALLVLAGVFVVLGAAAFIFKRLGLDKVLFTMAAAIALVGVAMFLAGAGMTLFAAGLATLAISGAAGFVVFTAGILGLIMLIPIFAQQVGYGMVAIAKVISEAGPVFLEAITTILLALLQAIIDVTPKLGEAITVLLAEGLRIIAEFIPDFAGAAYDLLIGMIDMLTEKTPELAEKGLDLAVALMDAFADKVPKLVGSAFDAMIEFMNALAAEIDSRATELGSAGASLLRAIVTGIVKAIGGAFEELLPGLGELVNSIIGFITEKLSDFSPISWLGDAVNGKPGSGDLFNDEYRSNLEKQGYTRNPSTGEYVGPGKNGIVVPSGDEEEYLANNPPDYGPAHPSVGQGRSFVPENLDVEPTITPQLDLSGVEEGANRMTGLLNGVPGLRVGQTFGQATAVAEAERIAREAAAERNSTSTGEPTVKIEQHNTSPRALSEGEIYRNTNSAFSLAKEALRSK